MQKFIITFLLSFLLVPGIGQTNRKTSAYLEGHYNQTLSDITKGNNPAGLGLGIQFFFRQRSLLNPTVELSGNVYPGGDKVGRLYPDRTFIPVVENMINLFAGASYRPLPDAYMSLVLGPSFVNGQKHFGIKPSFGFYFSSSKKLTGKVSFINIFNREAREKKDFSSVSFSLGVKLF